MGKKFEIRSATIADISGIQQVARLTWRDTYRAILPDVLIDDFLAHAYSDDSLAALHIPLTGMLRAASFGWQTSKAPSSDLPNSFGTVKVSLK